MRRRAMIGACITCQVKYWCPIIIHSHTISSDTQISQVYSKSVRPMLDQFICDSCHITCHCRDCMINTAHFMIGSIQTLLGGVGGHIKIKYKEKKNYRINVSVLHHCLFWPMVLNGTPNSCLCCPSIHPVSPYRNTRRPPTCPAMHGWEEGLAGGLISLPIETSTPSSTFGMYWKTNYEPGLITQH